MSINLIVAINQNNAISKDNKLIYRIKKDLERFRKKTEHNIVLMGRNTFSEIGRALPKRTNVVLTTQNDFEVPTGVFKESSFEKVLNHYLESGNQDRHLCICGGIGLYKQSLPFVNKVYLTYIYDNEKGDDQFPYDYIKKNFKEVKREKHEENGLKFDFIDYVRKEEY